MFAQVIPSALACQKRMISLSKFASRQNETQQKTFSLVLTMVTVTKVRKNQRKDSQWQVWVKKRFKN